MNNPEKPFLLDFFESLCITSVVNSRTHEATIGQAGPDSSG